MAEILREQGIGLCPSGRELNIIQIKNPYSQRAGKRFRTLFHLAQWLNFRDTQEYLNAFKSKRGRALVKRRLTIHRKALILATTS